MPQDKEKSTTLAFLSTIWGKIMAVVAFVSGIGGIIALANTYGFLLPSGPHAYDNSPRLHAEDAQWLVGTWCGGLLGNEKAEFTMSGSRLAYRHYTGELSAPGQGTLFSGGWENMRGAKFYDGGEGYVIVRKPNGDVEAWVRMGANRAQLDYLELDLPEDFPITPATFQRCG